ncbi:pentatricopeptide repeat-containing protein At1g31790 [Aristolochia californica]|uniref:pentatricopeptide repeat-containing protein At1g31790 n=1 Tax=Aristolochia californica TaxID=171875 RepID=UPI0035E15CBD
MKLPIRGMAVSPCKSIGWPTNDGAGNRGVHIKTKELPGSSVGQPLLHLRRPLPVPFEVKPVRLQSPTAPKERTRSRSTALDVLRLMDSLRVPISQDMYASLLKECIDSADLVQGTQVHQHIERSLPRLELALCNRLLLMYAACGRLDVAHNLFDAMAVRDPMSWTILIVAYAENSDEEEVLKLFVQMLRRGLQATTLVFVPVLKACIHKRDFRIGEQVHGLVLKTGNDTDTSLGRSLINFYAKFGCLEGARALFNRMARPNTVAWTSLIAGYCAAGLIDEALQTCKEMGNSGTKKNHYTLSTILRACGQKGYEGQELGRQVHAEAIKLGVESDPYVQISLVSMYGKCGLLRDARKAFEMSPKKKYMVWGALLNSYMLHGHNQKAIELLYEMKNLGVEPDESAVNALREACGS